jgi:hypothetical protein
MTQSRPKDEAKFLLPPYAISFEVHQTQKDQGNLVIRVHGGRHIVMRRQARYYFDSTESTPVILIATAYKWLAWFFEDERSRRDSNFGNTGIRRPMLPAFPLPKDSYELLELDLPDGTVGR